MALTFWQRVRVAFRGWSRRREEQQQEFLKKNVGWGAPIPPAAVTPFGKPAAASGPVIDREGLQAAYLDRSGVISYFLDVASGEVIESRGGEAPRAGLQRVPTPSNESDAADRRAFVETLEESQLRSDLVVADAMVFRKLLATNRAAERSWYSFKNDRASQAIESWIRGLGLQ